MIFAVVPAGGHSTRMGRPKLALPLGGRTVLEHVVASLRDGGVDHVLVVVGPHVPELVPLAEAAGADVCRLPEATADMRATVECGLRWLEGLYYPWPDDAWLLAPADHPALDPGVVRALCECYEGRPSQSILVPVCDGRRGHPTLISWQHVPGILAHRAGQGINTYLQLHTSEIREVPVTDASVLHDLDTPEDYERLCQNASAKRR
jgi:CTP:molybdopterin cytidylyltransferase MocA